MMDDGRETAAASRCVCLLAKRRWNGLAAPGTRLLFVSEFLLLFLDDDDVSAFRNSKTNERMNAFYAQDAKRRSDGVISKWTHT
jgi:hypothetical protein